MTRDPRHREAWKLPATRRFVAIVFAVIIIVIVIEGWANDNRSCNRSQVTRQGLNYAADYFEGLETRLRARLKFDTPAERQLDAQAVLAAQRAATLLRVPPLSCGELLPTLSRS